MKNILLATSTLTFAIALAAAGVFTFQVQPEQPMEMAPSSCFWRLACNSVEGDELDNGPLVEAGSVRVTDAGEPL